MNWIITKDVVNKGVYDLQRGNIGVDRYSSVADMCRSLPFEFRLKDADDEVYYYGRSNDRDTEHAFAPLDWAEADSGCTSIEYLVNGEWEVL